MGERGLLGEGEGEAESMSAKHNPKVAEYPEWRPCRPWIDVDDVVFLSAQDVYVCRRCRWRVVEALIVGAADDRVAMWIHTMPEPTEA